MKQSRFGAPVRLSGAGLLLSLVAPTAFAAIEEVIVTAQKRTESVQDVPISVSAFDAQALDAQQIDGFADLQFNVPNVSFSKGNFSGNNFQIRGIGTLLTATSGDSGVAQHINDVYVQTPRLFETEYYDIEQLEILRGPQGTLFGRNSTGGAVNIKTAKPVIGEFLYGGEAQAGNYANGRVKGAVNLPVGDNAALRFAGLWLNRDGYTNNVLTGNDVDSREQYSGRVSFRWEASDYTTIDLMASYFEEDSSRTRSQKQFCTQDPSGILGCVPSSTLRTESINPNATLGNLIGSNLLLGPLGAFNVFTPIADNNPDDVRTISAVYDPEYEADETLLTATINHDWNDWLTTTAVIGYQETTVVSRMDYNGTAGGATATVPAGFCATAPAACDFFGTSDGGPIWLSDITNPDLTLGSTAGDFLLDDRGAGRDLSGQEAEQISGELRFTTNLDGPVNFLLSFYYLDYETETDYFVQAPGLDYGNVALALGALGTPLVPDPTVAFPNAGLGYFNSETDLYSLKSTAVFGEAYWDVTDTVKLTLGLRWSEDEKRLRDRQAPLLGLGQLLVTGVDGSVTYIAPDFTATPVETLPETIALAAAAGAYDGDPSTPSVTEPFRDDTQTFDDITGRIVIDWAPDVGFTDETLLYASYSIGYKSGGFNPPVDASLFGSTPATYRGETIDAIEIGTKNTLMGGRLQANGNVFYYDYGDLQIGKIVNRTSLNENTDATIWGLEGEFVFAPDENWLFNASIAYLNTELGDTETIDPANPTQGRDDVTLIKDFPQASNCAVAFGSNAPVSANAALVGAIAGTGQPYLPTGTDLGPFSGGALAGAALPATPGVTDSAISSCAAIEAVLADPAFAGYEYLPSGAETNISGNQLLNAPELTISLGGQYTHYFDNGMSLTGRVDYYWQDEFYTSTFNRPQDLIDAWDVINAQVTLNGRDDKWYVRVFGQNLADENNIVGAYNTDPSSGLFVNGFFIEPRLYGATVGLRM